MVQCSLWPSKTSVYGPLVMQMYKINLNKNRKRTPKYDFLFSLTVSVISFVTGTDAVGADGHAYHDLLPRWFRASTVAVWFYMYAGYLGSVSLFSLLCIATKEKLKWL